MPAEVLRTTSRVNILKKVKVSGVWKLVRGVLEANGKLKDRVRIGGHVEPHSEGTYYIEWRENGRRLRAAIRKRNDVRARARLKGARNRTRARASKLVRAKITRQTSPCSRSLSNLLPQSPLLRKRMRQAASSRPLGPFLGQALEDAVKAQFSRLGFELAGELKRMGLGEREP